jgi:hypothetical protein
LKDRDPFDSRRLTGAPAPISPNLKDATFEAFSVQSINRIGRTAAVDQLHIRKGRGNAGYLILNQFKGIYTKALRLYPGPEFRSVAIKRDIRQKQISHSRSLTFFNLQQL